MGPRLMLLCLQPKTLQQGDRLTAKPSYANPAIIQQDLGVFDIFVRLCRLEWQASYHECWIFYIFANVYIVVH
ncbi:hypothetical protein MKW98_022915 [Papaver atlanticum]|uniref:Uncharacterized protein n=1 Tax=Papaver atlanticum TaxID=357466 RepID=A0AAD4XZ99_9MAGN|nr:hypothetical protein MKW98_022915 [Papaver atlanticum]